MGRGRGEATVLPRELRSLHDRQGQRARHGWCSTEWSRGPTARFSALSGQGGAVLSLSLRHSVAARRIPWPRLRLADLASRVEATVRNTLRLTGLICVLSISAISWTTAQQQKTVSATSPATSVTT